MLNNAHLLKKYNNVFRYILYKEFEALLRNLKTHLHILNTILVNSAKKYFPLFECTGNPSLDEKFLLK